MTSGAAVVLLNVVCEAIEARHAVERVGLRLDLLEGVVGGAADVAQRIGDRRVLRKQRESQRHCERDVNQERESARPEVY